MSRPVITLTSDFGLADGYVAAVKGVILGLCPAAVLVDVSHDVPPQAVLSGAFVLSTVVPYFAPGAVHLVVVDPGVGGERRPVAVQTARALYVAPDNGLLALALAHDPPQVAVHLRPERGWGLPGPLSATFHGRDLFAPAAARLACGAQIHDLGDVIPTAGLATPAGHLPRRQPDGSWLARVLHVDRFGNIITSFRPGAGSGPGRSPTSLHSTDRLVVRLGETAITGLRRTFSDVARGELLAYRGSSGYLEIGVRDGSAAARLDIGPGDEVYINLAEDIDG